MYAQCERNAPMTPANLAMQAASLNALDSPAPFRFLGRPQLPTSLCPPREGAWRAWGVINTSTANGQANTITLEADTYTLTAVDNDTDGPNGRRGPRGDPEPGQLRCHPSGSHEPAVWARGNPSDQGLGSTRRQSAEICRGVIAKSRAGHALNFALTVEGALCEGRRVPPTA
jgi:hypothetical protein